MHRLLELSAQPFNRISWQVGYEDPTAFCKVFQRTIGLNPGEYRRRFGITRN
jgi:transcriptional regulator GlxA family with amidase domain